MIVQPEIQETLMEKRSEIIIYRTEDGQTKIDVRLENETVWLSQKQMAELFQKDRSTITEHINNIFEEGELDRDSTSGNFPQVRFEGNRKVRRNVEFYNLDVIISVGYRVKSHRGTQFRIWATKKLKEYIIKGFVIDDERLEEGRTPRNYFDELLKRVRRIRASERNFYLKVTDIFATSVDYDPGTDYAKMFFASVQNKFHYAITGLTAAEIITKRIDSKKPNVGLTNWKGEIITSQQAKIAKNYLEEMELKRLELLVEQFLSYAELQSIEKHVMYMKDWIDKLDHFLIFNEKKILKDAGTVSHKEMEDKVRAELSRYNGLKKSSQMITSGDK